MKEPKPASDPRENRRRTRKRLLMSVLIFGPRYPGPPSNEPDMVKVRDHLSIEGIRDRLDREHDLQVGRAASLVQMDGLLAVAIGFAGDTGPLRPIWPALLSVLGAIASLSYWYSIELSSQAQHEYREMARLLLGSDAATTRAILGQPETSVHRTVNRSTQRWLMPHRAIPVISLGVWCSFLAAAIWAALIWADRPCPRRHPPKCRPD